MGWTKNLTLVAACPKHRIYQKYVHDSMVPIGWFSLDTPYISYAPRLKMSCKKYAYTVVSNCLCYHSGVYIPLSRARITHAASRDSFCDWRDVHVAVRVAQHYHSISRGGVLCLVHVNFTKELNSIASKSVIITFLVYLIFFSRDQVISIELNTMI